MIPSKTIEVLGSARSSLTVNTDSVYAVLAWDLTDLDALARRLSMGVRMHDDEARDWGNRLRLLVDQAAENDITQLIGG